MAPLHVATLTVYKYSKLTMLCPLNLELLTLTPSGSTVRNISAFHVLQDSFLDSKTTPLGTTIINSILYIFKSDAANYFIVQPHHTLPAFIEKMMEKSVEVQDGILSIIEHVIVEQKYIPTAELTSIGLMLSAKE